MLLILSVLRKSLKEKQMYRNLLNTHHINEVYFFMYSARELSFIFLFGGLVYGLIEVLFRGYTHWTMLVTGGACFLIFYILNFILKTDSILIRCVIAMIVITTLEFIVGYVVNIILKWNVWDYSNLFLNFMGQISALYSSIWFSMGVPMTIAANFLKSRF